MVLRNVESVLGKMLVILSLIWLGSPLYSAELEPSDEISIKVTGEVNSPGFYLGVNRSLLGVINDAGGFSEKTCPSAPVYITGKNKSKTEERTYGFKIHKIVRGNGIDILLPPGWVVTISNSYFGCGPNDLFNSEISIYLDNRNLMSEPVYNMNLMEFYEGKFMSKARSEKP